jgi:hypothetical protein
MQQKFVNTASGDALRCPSLPGAGAKQEQRLFRDLPELLSTAADGPCRCRKSYPCWSGDMVVLVEDAGESISSLDGEVVESV